MKPLLTFETMRHNEMPVLLWGEKVGGEMSKGIDSGHMLPRS